MEHWKQGVEKKSAERQTCHQGIRGLTEALPEQAGRDWAGKSGPGNFGSLESGEQERRKEEHWPAQAPGLVEIKGGVKADPEFGGKHANLKNGGNGEVIESQHKGQKESLEQSSSAHRPEEVNDQGKAGQP